MNIQTPHPNTAVPTDPGAQADPGALGAVGLSVFLDQVAGLLRNGLPERLWIEATIVDVRSSSSGFTIELSDAGAARGGAILRVFLSEASLVAIRRDLGLSIDPVMLTGMTTCLLVAPAFTRRWHLGGRVKALARSAAASLRQRLLERTIAALKAEGLWDRQRMLPQPRDVTRIAIIHPAGAVGWADIAGELGRWERAGLVRVRSHPTPFEGEHAPAAIVAALGDAVQPIAGNRPDLVIAVRGGGSRSGLAALDHDGVARAVLRCPIPIICGTGHATDRTLADRVAWRATDTPSKALALVAGVICNAAQAARADHGTILTTAFELVATHERQLVSRREALIAGLEGLAIATAHRLAAIWSVVLVEATRRREHIARLGDAASMLLRSALAAAPATVEAEEGRLTRMIGESLDRARRASERHSDGAALLGAVDQAAKSGLERQEAGLRQLRDGVGRGADRLLHHAEAELSRLGAVLDGSDLTAILQRGFALVTDPAGRLVRTRARAAASGQLTIRFADGVLEVSPDAEAGLISERPVEP